MNIKSCQPESPQSEYVLLRGITALTKVPNFIPKYNDGPGTWPEPPS
jgi:hypothetical protein